MYRQANKPIRPTLRTDGPRMFYYGFTGTLLRTFGSTTLFFPTLDLFNDLLRKHSELDQKITFALAGTLSATTTATILQPIDYIRTRWSLANTCVSTQSRPKWYQIPYFRGLSLNLLRNVPHLAITAGLIKVIESYID